MVGPPAVGKSTLAMELVCRGYPLLADDLAAVSEAGRRQRRRHVVCRARIPGSPIESGVTAGVERLGAVCRARKPASSIRAGSSASFPAAAPTSAAALPVGVIYLLGEEPVGDETLLIDDALPRDALVGAGGEHLGYPGALNREDARPRISASGPVALRRRRFGGYASRDWPATCRGITVS